MKLADIVWWKGHEKEGLWFISDFCYRLANGERAASVVPVNDNTYSKIAPASELRVVIDSEELEIS